MENGTTPSIIPNSKKSRGQLRKEKAKAKALAPTPSTPLTNGTTVEVIPTPIVEIKLEEEDIAQDYITEAIQQGQENAFAEIFSKFALPGTEVKPEVYKEEGLEGKGEVIYSDDEMPSESDEIETEESIEMSKRKQRKLNRLSVAELKRLVKRPEVVDWVDVSATDPKLLVQIKSARNTIPIPQHWSAKRDYLNGRRGVEKAAFVLPSFIADTGIASQRDAIKEKEDGQSLKAKTRERVQPKMGKIDIDYQKLHDAFFKFQTKPPMTEFGEIYYEGKELETNLKEKKPGDLSEELKEALSIPPLAPPPWLISMQRYGPPPSYPNLRISGLNSPIPEGAAWGFHPGGWGKPPLDDNGRPLYGDIYGITQTLGEAESGVPIDKTVWGELEPDEEDSEEEDSDSEDEEESSAPGDGLQTPSGMDTPSGFTSVASTVPGGIETPDFLDLRKRRDGTESVDQGPKSLYQVIPEKDNRIRGLMGSDRAYDVSGITGPVLGQEERGNKRKATGGVEVALDASELEGLTDAELRVKLAEASKQSRGTHEDFSDLVEQEVAKRRKTADSKRKDAGKEKFKF